MNWIQVNNSGDGIPQNDLHNIFDRYYMVNKEKHRIDGSGLGLAIVKKILDLHHSTIQATSTHNMQTSFKFSLPIYQ